MSTVINKPTFNGITEDMLREDLNKVIDGLFNNHDIYEAVKALRKIIDKIRV